MSTLTVYTGANLVVFCNCYQTTKLAGIFLSSALFIPFFILVYEKKGPSVKTIAGSKKRIHYLTFACVITYQKQRVCTSQFKRNQKVTNDRSVRCAYIKTVSGFVGPATSEYVWLVKRLGSNLQTSAVRKLNLRRCAVRANHSC